MPCVNKPPTSSRTCAVGGVSSPDAGFLMAASMDLLLGEIHFLMSLLHLTQGPRSPHLKALVAVLKVLW